MLTLAENLLKAIGFCYDDTEKAWVAPARPRVVATVECDEDRAYIMEALLEFHDVLKAAGWTYDHVAISGPYVSIVGLMAAGVAVAA